MWTCSSVNMQHARSARWLVKSSVKSFTKSFAKSFAKSFVKSFAKSCGKISGQAGSRPADPAGLSWPGSKPSGKDSWHGRHS